MSSTVCRYGMHCRRNDCFFAHPEGKISDQQHKGGVDHHSGRGGGDHHSGRGGVDHHSGRGGHHGGYNPKAAIPCKFDRQCTRVECYFGHPNGREIDDEQMLYYADQLQDSNDTDYGESEVLNEIDEITEYNELKDEWIPSSRDCSCCKGFVYGCSDPVCLSLGICGCAAEQP